MLLKHPVRNSCGKGSEPSMQQSETGTWLLAEEHIVRDIACSAMCNGNLEVSAMTAD